MSSVASSYSGVAVAVPVTSGYARTSRRSMPWFLSRTFAELIARSGIAKTEIDGLVVSSYLLGPENAASLTQYLGVSPRFLLDLPYGGASGVIALKRAARAVQSGDAEIVACLSGDIAQYGYGFNASFSSFQRDHVYPYGGGGQNAVFAMITDNYMRAHGAVAEDFGRVCIAQRANGITHPLALYRTPLTMEAYLASRLIAEPLRLLDCVTRMSGSDGFLVMSQDRARRAGLPHATILGSVERHNAFPDDPVMSRFGLLDESEGLYAQAGLGPDDMDFFEAYDDYPVIVMMQLEAMGFCRPGEAPKLLRERRLDIEGDLPLNTNGGMLSIGQAGAAGGYQNVTEGLRQLTGQAMGAQVPGARVGLVNGFGTVNYERGICNAAVILETGSVA